MWQQYRENAVDKLGDAELLFSQRRYAGTEESAFFAIEIALKAWMARKTPALGSCRGPREAQRRGIAPGLIQGFFAHEIGDILAATSELEMALDQGCPREYNLLCQLGADSQRWRPWKRYQSPGDPETAQLYFNLANGLVKWMLEHSLKE
jgi:hypothetical protein